MIFNIGCTMLIIFQKTLKMNHVEHENWSHKNYCVEYEQKS